MILAERILTFLAPHNCIACGFEGALLCLSCRTYMAAVPERCYLCQKLSDNYQTCKSCRRRVQLAGVRVCTFYEGNAKTLLWRLKFERANAAAAEIAEMMHPLVMSYQDHIIVHVPTASSRVRQRGYDQAALIAQTLAKQSGLPHRTLLARVGQQHQVGATRSQRQEQLKKAFRPLKTQNIRDKKILLIDDVLTTGATLESAAATLKAAGARRIEAVVFAAA